MAGLVRLTAMLPIDMKQYRAVPDAFAMPITPDQAISYFCSLLCIVAIVTGIR